VVCDALLYLKIWNSHYSCEQHICKDIDHNPVT
jgi:hypothetical protein